MDPWLGERDDATGGTLLLLPAEGWAVNAFKINVNFGLQLRVFVRPKVEEIGKFGEEWFAGVTFDGDFVYRDADDRVWSLDPYPPGPHLAPVLALYGRTVERAIAYDDGRLSVAFTDGSALTAAAHHDYEAWQVWREGPPPRRMRAVVTCYGEVAYF